MRVAVLNANTPSETVYIQKDFYLGDVRGRKTNTNSNGKKRTTGRGRPTIYRELAGQDFWAELTGDRDFYLKIIKLMGTQPEKYLEQYKASYAKASNRLIKQFTNDFCDDDGNISWDKLVKFNSGYTD